MPIIFFQSLIATVWSLYYGFYGDPIANSIAWDMFNPANGFLPCELCWYARILMYPLVWISWIAWIRDDWKSIYTMIPFVVLGIWLELYHYLLQKNPNLETSFTCTANNPCDALWVNYFGFLTIPLLCLIAFCVIWLSIIYIYMTKREVYIKQS